MCAYIFIIWNKTAESQKPRPLGKDHFEMKIATDGIYKDGQS